jgi:putative tricarboxylic transport membrane protein
MRKTEELVVHGVVFLIMLMLYFETKSFPDMNIGGSLGPEWWPQVILTLGMLLTVLSASLAGRKKTEPGRMIVDREEIISLTVSALIFAVFLVMIEVFGFVGAAPILVAGFIWQLGGRKITTLIGASVGCSIGFVLLFGRFMEVPLPRGMGAIRSLSYLLY